MDHWLRAKHELMYKKQRANALSEVGVEPQAAMVTAELEIKNEIKYRAFLIYCATKDYTLDNWLQAKCECYGMPDFDNKVNFLAQKWVEASDYWLKTKAARKLAKVEFIRTRAYYIWENRWKMEHDWYTSEKSLENHIKNRAQEIMTTEPYLSEEEAWYCARDSLHPVTEIRAYTRQKWIAECAYYLAQKNPNNSAYDNWCFAAQQYDIQRLERFK